MTLNPSQSEDATNIDQNDINNLIRALNGITTPDCQWIVLQKSIFILDVDEI